MREDAGEIALQPLGKGDERMDPTADGSEVPGVPEPSRGASIAIGAEMLEIVFQDIYRQQLAVGAE